MATMRGGLAAFQGRKDVLDIGGGAQIERHLRKLQRAPRMRTCAIASSPEMYTA